MQGHQLAHHANHSENDVLSATTPEAENRADRSAANRILRRNEHLFHAGETITHPYIVVAGVFKSYVVYEDGDDQVLGFHVPGDIIGFDAMVGRTTFCAVMALDTSSVRKLSLPEYAALRNEQDSGSQKLLASMYNEILRLSRLLHMERGCSTTRRLAAFLLEYSDYQCQRGYSRHELHLPMKRRDLAGYLGLATETLSRAFSHFRDRGLLAVNTNDIMILDMQGLQTIAGYSQQSSDQGL